jgi:hypothetical protein
MTADPKAAGKRPTTMIGSGGSSPPCKRFLGTRWCAIHLLQFFPFFLPTLHPGFLILTCMLQGDEPGCVAGIPGLLRSWRYQGRRPLGFDGRCGP